MSSITSPATAAPGTGRLDRAAYIHAWEEWHRAHEARRADPHGFLAITALHWLDQTPRRLAGLPGEWSSADEAHARIDLAADEARGGGLDTALSDRVPIAVEDGPDGSHSIVIGPIAERSGTTLGHGDVHVEVARRGGRIVVRPRDPASAFLADYRGTPVYPPNPRWIARGVFRRLDRPESVTVGSAAPQIHHVYDSPGTVEFSLLGETFSLVAFEGHAPGTLSVLFTDATSGITTYAANRSLAIPAPDEQGRVTLDFNRAVNLPCAYTDFATCPLPPAANRLPIAIEAGEKTPLARNTDPSLA